MKRVPTQKTADVAVRSPRRLAAQAEARPDGGAGVRLKTRLPGWLPGWWLLKRRRVPMWRVPTKTLLARLPGWWLLKRRRVPMRRVPAQALLARLPGWWLLAKRMMVLTTARRLARRRVPDGGAGAAGAVAGVVASKRMRVLTTARRLARRRVPDGGAGVAGAVAGVVAAQADEWC